MGLADFGIKCSTHACPRIQHMLRESDKAIQNAKEKVFLDPDGKHICLNINYAYYVPLAECSDIVGICRWIFHLQHKPWMNGYYLRRFAKLACAANTGRTPEGMPWDDFSAESGQSDGEAEPEIKE